MAIGGNALSPSGERATVVNQFRHARESLEPVVSFARDGWRVAVVHGNGPQVGDEIRRAEVARGEVEPLPLGVLVASTQGWIGYMIQQSLQNALARRGSDRPVVSVVTQVRVDPAEPGAGEPRKFIGREVDRAGAERLRDRGVTVERDAEGRLRRRVASPDPVEIVELGVVRELLEAGALVVAAGGGGIPVYRDPALGLEGMDVVVDKDRAAALLARGIRARILLVLTDVEGVYEAFGTADARLRGRLSPSEARGLLAGDELGVGSMRPKVEAGLEFVEAGGERAVIADLESAEEALSGRAGTEIVARPADG